MLEKEDRQWELALKIMKVELRELRPNLPKTASHLSANLR